MSREWWPTPAKPIAVTGGIAAKRKQGSIGESWWSRRFIDVLESFGLENRIARGRSYARRGQVTSLDVNAGVAHAVVQGSRARPYRVIIGVDELSDDDWTRVGEAFASKAVFLAKLLAGEMPQNIEEAFDTCSLSLFPETLDGLETVCSCPDSANPCKHIAAVLYLLAEAFDDDPFLIFTWRGRTKDQILETLRASRAGASGVVATVDVASAKPDLDEAFWSQLPGDEPVAAAFDNFWSVGDGLDNIVTRAIATDYPDVFLRQLDVFPEKVGNQSVVEILAPLYPVIASAAQAKTDV